MPLRSAFLLTRAISLANLTLPIRFLPFSLFLLQYEERRGNVYNILWALVFGFATLNILSLVGRRFEPSRSRLSFGETLAIMVVIMSVVLLGWEMLHIFKVFPIRLSPR